MQVKKELQIIGLAASESSPGNFTLILEEPGSKLQIPVIIGSFEAQSIAVYFERIQSIRPLTYELFHSILSASEIRIIEVLIYSYQEDTFFAWICLLRSSGEILKIDARVSDAIALGIRFDCVISMYESVIEQVSIAQSEKKLSLLKGSLAAYSDEALEQLLQSILKKEDYESAARIRDMIRKRRS